MVEETQLHVSYTWPSARQFIRNRPHSQMYIGICHTALQQTMTRRCYLEVLEKGSKLKLKSKKDVKIRFEGQCWALSRDISRAADVDKYSNRLVQMLARQEQDCFIP